MLRSYEWMNQDEKLLKLQTMLVGHDKINYQRFLREEDISPQHL